MICEQESMKDEIQFMVTQCTQSGISIYLYSVYMEKLPSPGRFQIQDKKYFCTKETRFLLFLFSLLGLIFLVIHREEKGSQDSSLFPSAQDGGRKARERGRKEGFR